jgi:hypothetical protein
MTYLWFCPNLIGPAAKHVPLATWDGSSLVWAPGQPQSAASTSSAAADMVASVEWLLANGVRFDQAGMSAGNVVEGRPFTREDILPGLSELSKRVRVLGGFKWERHGPSWALYVGRGANLHGLNLLTVLDNTDAWDHRHRDVRAFIEAAMNWCTYDNKENPS